MSGSRLHCRIGCLLGAAMLQLPLPAAAEKADKEKPVQIEANRMSADEARRLTLFEGNVVFTKGTLSVRADRIVVRQDAEGFQHASATGNPVQFRQKTDSKNGEPGIWIAGEAQRVEIDDREEKVELFERARVTRGQDEVRGEYILLDQRSEFFTVTGGKDGQTGRVQVTIQPKTQPSASPPQSPGMRPAKPPPAQ
jgi:lipopolysaccharide export system protein LptA